MWSLLPALVFLQQGSSFTFGTDPTEAVTRLEVAFEHARLRDGDVVDATTTRVDVAFFESLVVRADVPFAHVDPLNAGSEKGLGDLRAQLGWRAYADRTFSIFFAGGVVLDSAEEEALGMGQKQVVAMVAASGALPESNSHVYETVEHFVSFDSDNDRQGVALTKLDIHVMTEWSETVWTQAGGEFFVDWKGGEHTGLNLDFEAGKSLGSGFSMWVRPGAGVFGKDVPGVVDWNVVVGLRWVF